MVIGPTSSIVAEERYCTVGRSMPCRRNHGMTRLGPGAKSTGDFQNLGWLVSSSTIILLQGFVGVACVHVEGG